ncbi:MAG TPA: hypothetical protein VEU32_20200 [Burkholderiales bacterium]|nr:hypothetical protein [Burkholderiales bacterium]
MRFVIGSLPQMFVMAAIVNTALFVPLGGILALLSFVLFGSSLHGFLTFGGVLGNIVEGLVAWWTILLMPSLVYAATVMPWRPKD